MSLLKKEQLPQVTMEFMNEVHEKDLKIINELYDLVLFYEKEKLEENREALEKKYQEWFEHTIKHFKGEEDKMLELKFPPYPMHKGEHENALHRMDEIFRSFKETQDIDFLKNYLSKELPSWLLNHIQTMDAVTAQFFKTGMSPCSVN